jgi:N-acetylneuraminate synthase
MDFVSRNCGFADGDPVVVIGEVGVNHNGDIAIARRLVDAAVAAGVDVVKFQAFKTEKEISRFAALAPYQREAVSDVKSQFELVKALELPASAFRELSNYCKERGIGFLASVFDYDSIDLIVDELKNESVKVASGEITNIPMLEYIGSRKVGVILSTGASTLDEVGFAVRVLRRSGCPEIVLLHCVSNYPAPADELNLRAMATMRQQFGLPVGFSDHSMGIDASVAAVALGAVAIEKHFTLDRTMTGPDHSASIEPDALARLVEGVRVARMALGDGVKKVMPSEMANLPLIRRSLVANGHLRQGTRLTREMIEIKRPAEGIEPRDLEKVVGRELARDLKDDEPITWANLV